MQIVLPIAVEWIAGVNHGTSIRLRIVVEEIIHLYDLYITILDQLHRDVVAVHVDGPALTLLHEPHGLLVDRLDDFCLVALE